MDRRSFLGRLAVVAMTPGMVPFRRDARRRHDAHAHNAIHPAQEPPQGAPQGAPQAQGEESALPGQGNVGTLRNPAAAGRPRSPTEAHENAAAIQRIEQRLACSCGCTLDIFTCRTTDFTCTYSPQLHREVLALWKEGKRGDEIVDAFVAKYGEKALMAPKPEGFNLAGYFVPGAAVLTAGGLLLAVLVRRRAKLAAAGVAAPASRAATSGALDATPEELERLRRALADADD